jgi:hypothetical protein
VLLLVKSGMDLVCGERLSGFSITGSYRTACAVPLSSASVTGRLAPFRYRVRRLPDGLRRSAIECVGYRTACAVPLSNAFVTGRLAPFRY